MKLLLKIEKFFVGTLLAILIVFTFVNVILRYFFNYSMMGSVEISILMFAWIVFVGSSIAISSDSHIKINLLEFMLSDKINRSLSIVISVIILIVSIYLCFIGVIFTIEVFGEKLGATNIPKALVYASLPVGFGLTSIHIIYQLMTVFKAKEGQH